MVLEELALVMHLATGFQPFRPLPSTESFLAPLLLDVIMEEKFNGYKAADVPRMSVPGANRMEPYPNTLPYFTASFLCTFLGKYHNYTSGIFTVQMDVDHLEYLHKITGRVPVF